MVIRAERKVVQSLSGSASLFYSLLSLCSCRISLLILMGLLAAKQSRRAPLSLRGRVTCVQNHSSALPRYHRNFSCFPKPTGRVKRRKMLVIWQNSGTLWLVLDLALKYLKSYCKIPLASSGACWLSPQHKLEVISAHERWQISF